MCGAQRYVLLAKYNIRHCCTSRRPGRPDHYVWSTSDDVCDACSHHDVSTCRDNCSAGHLRSAHLRHACNNSCSSGNLHSSCSDFVCHGRACSSYHHNCTTGGSIRCACNVGDLCSTRRHFLRGTSCNGGTNNHLCRTSNDICCTCGTCRHIRCTCPSCDDLCGSCRDGRACHNHHRTSPSSHVCCTSTVYDICCPCCDGRAYHGHYSAGSHIRRTSTSCDDICCTPCDG
mmetsp:Transcript_104559/g.305268  ORF Transcript_104559/g.305268 Transcript_104559/m.305268 type:complete len:230 (-) Transcript_104559:20-709(-)